MHARRLVLLVVAAVGVARAETPPSISFGGMGTVRLAKPTGTLRLMARRIALKNNDAQCSYYVGRVNTARTDRISDRRFVNMSMLWTPAINIKPTLPFGKLVQQLLPDRKGMILCVQESKYKWRGVHFNTTAGKVPQAIVDALHSDAPVEGPTSCQIVVVGGPNHGVWYRLDVTGQTKPGVKKMLASRPGLGGRPQYAVRYRPGKTLEIYQSIQTYCRKLDSGQISMDTLLLRSAADHAVGQVPLGVGGKVTASDRQQKVLADMMAMRAGADLAKDSQVNRLLKFARANYLKVQGYEILLATYAYRRLRSGKNIAALMALSAWCRLHDLHEQRLDTLSKAVALDFERVLRRDRGDMEKLAKLSVQCWGYGLEEQSDRAARAAMAAAPSDLKVKRALREAVGYVTDPSAPFIRNLGWSIKDAAVIDVVGPRGLLPIGTKHELQSAPGRRLVVIRATLTARLSRSDAVAELNRRRIPARRTPGVLVGARRDPNAELPTAPQVPGATLGLLSVLDSADFRVYAGTGQAYFLNFLVPPPKTSPVQHGFLIGSAVKAASRGPGQTRDLMVRSRYTGLVAMGDSVTLDLVFNVPNTVGLTRLILKHLGASKAGVSPMKSGPVIARPSQPGDASTTAAELAKTVAAAKAGDFKAKLFLKFKANAEAGREAGMLNVADQYREGFGIARNYTEAARWYLKVAQAGGHHSAMYYLGTMYLKGQGVAKDREKGLRWIRKAADQGNNNAKSFLRRGR